MDSRKSHCNPARSPLLGGKSFALALTLLNYHSIAIATLGELFNRSEKANAIVLWCNTDRGDGAIGCQVSGLLSVGRHRLMPKSSRQSEKAITPKVQAGLRIHAL